MLAVGWALLGSAAATEVWAAATGLWAGVVSVWIFGVSVRLSGAVPSFPSRSQCLRLAVPFRFLFRRFFRRLFRLSWILKSIALAFLRHDDFASLRASAGQNFQLGR